MAIGLPLAVALAVASILIGRSGTGSGPTVSVLVASGDISQSTALSSNNVTVADRPASAVPAGSLTQLGSVAGQYGLVTIPNNTVITSSLLTTNSTPTPVAPSNGISLKDGEVAMSIPYSPANGAGGFVKAADHVDILVLVPGTGAVQYGFEDILVLKVGTAAQQANGAPSSLLVAVTRGEAKAMAALLAGGGSSSDNATATIAEIVLRPADQAGTGDLPSDTYVAPTDTPLRPSDLQALFKQ